LLGQHPRVHVQKLDQVQGFVAVLGDLNHDFDSDPDGFGELRLLVTPSRIVSTRRHPLRTVDHLRRALNDGLSVPEGSTLGLFQRLIETLAETFSGVTEKLGEQVDDAEDRILAGSYQKPGRVLGAIRRLLVRLRRLLVANRSALLRAPDRLLSVDDTEHRRGLREALDRLDAVSQDLTCAAPRRRDRAPPQRDHEPQPVRAVDRDDGALADHADNRRFRHEHGRPAVARQPLRLRARAMDDGGRSDAGALALESQSVVQALGPRTQLVFSSSRASSSSSL
jgi:hypothetical protein